MASGLDGSSRSEAQAGVGSKRKPHFLSEGIGVIKASGSWRCIYSQFRRCFEERVFGLV